MSKIWFTADTHFGSKRTLELSKRPFTGIHAMDQTTINNWNEKISCNDTVYHLGDFGDAERMDYLGGQSIKILPGNYDDKKILEVLQKDNRVEILEDPFELTINNKKYFNSEFVLTHKPIQFSSTFHLFGHIHKLQMIKKFGLNVGVDCHNFYPIDLDTVLFYQNGIINHYDNYVFQNVHINMLKESKQ